MKKSLQKLLSISSPAISDQFVGLTRGLPQDLEEMLNLRNGFYAFECALHVFPTVTSINNYGLDIWNNKKTWLDNYDNTEDCFFFAEDVFGSQFCFYNGRIESFDAETGNRSPIAESLESWASKILADYNYLTGYSLAHAWQEKNGRIPVNTRLIPKIPFFCGGSFTHDNLFAYDSIKSMKLRGDIARQVKHLPDGTKIKFKYVD